MTPFHHGDISGNAVVQIEEFSIIVNNFLMGSQVNCCGQPGFNEPPDGGPRTSISVRELARMGIGAAADVNRDGVVDLTDAVEVLNGTPPVSPPPPGDPVEPIGPVPPGDLKWPPDTGTGGSPPPVGRRP